VTDAAISTCPGSGLRKIFVNTTRATAVCALWTTFTHASAPSPRQPRRASWQRSVWKRVECSQIDAKAESVCSRIYASHYWYRIDEARDDFCKRCEHEFCPEHRDKHEKWCSLINSEVPNE